MNVLNHSPLHSQSNMNEDENNPPQQGISSVVVNNRKKPNPKHNKIKAAGMNSIHPHDNNYNNASSSGSSSDEDSQTFTSHSKSKKSVVIIHDDLMTEDDTDIEDELLELGHERNEVPPELLSENDLRKKSADSGYEYNAYTTSHHDSVYHPTSSIYEDSLSKNDNNGTKSIKSNNNNQPDLLNRNETIDASFLAPQFSTSEESIFQDTSYYERTAFNRRPSQLQHEMTTLNALGPPSHVLKARRLSKNTIKSSSSTPIITPVKSLSATSLSSSVRDKRKPSVVDNYTKEFSNNSNSAVSPRFMALRKLSEVTALPPHSISYSAVPPVPQIPSTFQNPAVEQSASFTNDQTDTTTINSTTLENITDHENRVIARIDDIIETQLQFHLGQVVWRASESHLEARRFWEEQKKEMFGFAASLVDRMDNQEDITRRMTVSSLVSPSSSVSPTPDFNQKDVKELEQLRKERNSYKSKSQRQVFEVETLKARNAELEKQHEIDIIAITKMKDKQRQKSDQPEQKENQPTKQGSNIIDGKQKNVEIKLFNLETENKQLKNQVKQMQAVNRQLLEDATTFETNLNSRDKEIKRLKQHLMKAEMQIQKSKKRGVITSSAATAANGDEELTLDCGEDFGKRASINTAVKKNDNDERKEDTNTVPKTEEINDKRDTADSKINAVNNDKKEDIQKTENWADIMQSEDEAKKSAEDWANRYRELQTSYFEACLQLEQLKENSVSSNDEKKIIELKQLIIVKDEEIRHLKQAENVNRIQMDYLQLELDKYQNLPLSRPASSLEIEESSIKQHQKTSYRSKRKTQNRKSTNSAAPVQNESNNMNKKVIAQPPAPYASPKNVATSASPVTNASPARDTTPADYVTEDGFLTFTTEINGKLSKYSIKLPVGCGRPINNTSKRNTPTHEPKLKKNKLNPNAVTWKS